MNSNQTIMPIYSNLASKTMLSLLKTSSKVPPRKFSLEIKTLLQILSWWTKIVFPPKKKSTVIWWRQVIRWKNKNTPMKTSKRITKRFHILRNKIRTTTLKTLPKKIKTSTLLTPQLRNASPIRRREMVCRVVKNQQPRKACLSLLNLSRTARTLENWLLIPR
jgi:hypothetical protein